MSSLRTHHVLPPRHQPLVDHLSGVVLAVLDGHALLDDRVGAGAQRLADLVPAGLNLRAGRRARLRLHLRVHDQGVGVGPRVGGGEQRRWFWLLRCRDVEKAGRRCGVSRAMVAAGSAGSAGVFEDSNARGRKPSFRSRLAVRPRQSQWCFKKKSRAGSGVEPRASTRVQVWEPRSPRNFVERRIITNLLCSNPVPSHSRDQGRKRGRANVRPEQQGTQKPRGR